VAGSAGSIRTRSSECTIPIKILFRMSGEAAAAVTKDCFGFNPEIELPPERRHALAQKLQWPETGKPFGHDPLGGVEKTNEPNVPAFPPMCRK